MYEFFLWNNSGPSMIFLRVKMLEVDNQFQTNHTKSMSLYVLLSLSHDIECFCE